MYYTHVLLILKNTFGEKCPKHISYLRFNCLILVVQITTLPLMCLAMTIYTCLINPHKVSDENFISKWILLEIVPRLKFRLHLEGVISSIPQYLWPFHFITLNLICHPSNKRCCESYLKIVGDIHGLIYIHIQSWIYITHSPFIWGCEIGTTHARHNSPLQAMCDKTLEKSLRAKCWKIRAPIMTNYCNIFFTLHYLILEFVY